MILLTEEKDSRCLVEFVFEADSKISSFGMGLEHVFHGEYQKSIYVPGKDQAVLLVGCGRPSNLGLLEVRELSAYGAGRLQEMGIWECAVDMEPFVRQMGDQAVTQTVLGLLLGTYEYKVRHQICYRLRGIEDTQDNRDLIYEAQELAKNILFVRETVNMPGNLLRPLDFSRVIEQHLEGTEVEVQTIDCGQMELLGLKGLCGIGGSSEFPPCLMVLRYRGRPRARENYGLIGKGVTCDTGGYCLKGAKSMAGIKGDMAGAAAVAGAVRAAAAQKLKVNLTAVLPLCENRISPSSHLPGDVITSYNGKTVEIVNTDAEGRLILADAMSYGIRKEKVTHVLDIATLTGAVWQALGYTVAGSMSDNEEFYRMFEGGLAFSGERYLRFPFGKEHEKMIESQVADLKNVGENCCGVITAGLFLRHFAEGLPWIHLDIAGTAWNEKPSYAFESRGATGAGVLSLYYLLKEAGR